MFCGRISYGAFLAGLFLTFGGARTSAQVPADYRPPAAAPEATPGTLPLGGLPAGVRDAVLAAIDAKQAWSSAAADDHLAYALSIDSTFGLARVLRGNLRGVNPALGQHARGTADAAGRPVGEQIVALAYRAYPPESTALFAAATTVFPNDHRMAMEYALRLRGSARADSLRSLIARYPEFVAPRIWLASDLIEGPNVVATQTAEEALRLAREAADLAADVAGSHVIIGHVLQRTGRHDDATEHLREALRIDPKNSRAYELQAEISMREGASPHGIETARAFLDSARAYTISIGRNWEIARTASLLLMHESRIDEMIAADTTLLRDAERLRWRPFATSQWGRLAVQVGAAGRSSLTDEYLAEARRIYPEPSNIMLGNEILAYAVTGRPIEARRALVAYTAAVGVNPTATDAAVITSYAAMVLHAEGKHAESLAECAKIASNAATQWCDYVRVESNLASGNTGEAERLRSAFLARNDLPNESLVWAIMKYRSRGRG